MTRLTDEELTEPDVVLEVPYERWDRLPARVTDWLRLFVKEDRYLDGLYVVRLPGYRYRELLQEVTP